MKENPVLHQPDRIEQFTTEIAEMKLPDTTTSRKRSDAPWPNRR